MGKTTAQDAKITLLLMRVAQKRLWLSFLIMIIQKLQIGLELNKIVLHVFKNSYKNILS